jgi:hypothetical protein
MRGILYIHLIILFVSGCGPIERYRFIDAYSTFYQVDTDIAACAFDTLSKQNDRAAAAFLEFADSGGQWSSMSFDDSGNVGMAALAGATCRLNAAKNNLKNSPMSPQKPTSIQILQ